MISFEEHMKARSDEIQKILNSPIIARATVQLEGKEGVIIIAAFELSTRNMFWFTFTAKNSRSPRKSWKRKNIDILWQGKFLTIQNMIDKIAITGKTVKSSYRFPKGKRLFIDRMDRVINPLKYQSPIQNPESISVTYLNRKLARKMRGSVPMGWCSRT